MPGLYAALQLLGAGLCDHLQRTERRHPGHAGPGAWGRRRISPAIFPAGVSISGRSLAAVNEELTALLYRRQYNSRIQDSRAAVCRQYGQLSAPAGLLPPNWGGTDPGPGSRPASAAAAGRDGDRVRAVCSGTGGGG